MSKSLAITQNLVLLIAVCIVFVSSITSAKAGSTSSSGVTPGSSDINPGSADTIRRNYFLRYPAAKEFAPTTLGGSDQVVDGTSIGTGAMVIPKSGPVCVWPLNPLTLMSSMIPSQVPTWRDTAINNDLFQTYGYPVSDTQFQLIQRYNDNRFLDQLFDPEKIIWAATAIGNIQAAAGSSSANSMAYNQAANAINYMGSYLENFTVMANNRWGAIRNQLFIPIAILLLLPGAVLAQVRAIVAAGTPVLGEVSPFEGIFRSLIALFMIPGTYLIMNYGIDISNSITYTIATGYSNLFGSNMYIDALNAQKSANQIMPTSNQMATTPTSSSTSQPPAEQASFSQAGTALLMGLTKGSLSTTWNLLCAFQVVYLRYLWCMGPIVAALWVWPMQSLRAALPSWIEGVVVLCFWSLFWNTTIALLACFYGMSGPGLVIITAITLLANIVVSYAFNFSGLASSAGMLLSQQLSRISVPGASNATNATRGSATQTAAGGKKAGPTPKLTPAQQKAQQQAILSRNIGMLQSATTASTYALNTGNRNPYAPIGSPGGARIGDMGVGMMDPSYSGASPMNLPPQAGYNSQVLNPTGPYQLSNAGGILANAGFSGDQASLMAGLSTGHALQYSPGQITNLKNAGFSADQINAMQASGFALQGMNPGLASQLTGAGFNPAQINALSTTLPVGPGMPPAQAGSTSMGATPPGGAPYLVATGIYNDGLMNVPPPFTPGGQMPLVQGAQLPPGIASQMVPMPNGELGSMGIAPHIPSYPTALNGEPLAPLPIQAGGPANPNNAYAIMHNAGFSDQQIEALRQSSTGQPVHYTQAEQEMLAGAGLSSNQIVALEATGFQMHGSNPMLGNELANAGINPGVISALGDAQFNGPGSLVGPPASGAPLNEFQNNVNNLEHAGFGQLQANNLAGLSQGSPLLDATAAQQQVLNNETLALKEHGYSQAQISAIEQAGVGYNSQTGEFFNPTTITPVSPNTFDMGTYSPMQASGGPEHVASNHANESTALPTPQGNIGSYQEYQNLVDGHKNLDNFVNSGGKAYENPANLAQELPTGATGNPSTPGLEPASYTTNGAQALNAEHAATSHSQATNAEHTATSSAQAPNAEHTAASPAQAPANNPYQEFESNVANFKEAGLNNPQELAQYATGQALPDSSPADIAFKNHETQILQEHGYNSTQINAIENAGIRVNDAGQFERPQTASAYNSFATDVANFEFQGQSSDNAIRMAAESTGYIKPNEANPAQSSPSQNVELAQVVQQYSTDFNNLMAKGESPQAAMNELASSSNTNPQFNEYARNVENQYASSHNLGLAESMAASSMANSQVSPVSNDNMQSQQSFSQAQSNAELAMQHQATETTNGTFDNAAMTPMSPSGNTEPGQANNVSNHKDLFEANVNGLAQQFGATEAANMAQYSSGTPLSAQERLDESQVLSNLGYNQAQINAIENAGIRVDSAGQFISLEPSAANNYTSYAQEVNNLVQSGYSINEAERLVALESASQQTYSTSELNNLTQNYNLSAQEIAASASAGITYNNLINNVSGNTDTPNSSNFDNSQSYVNYLVNSGQFSPDEAQYIAQYVDSNPNQYSLGDMPQYTQDQINGLKANYDLSDANIQAMENLGVVVSPSGQFDAGNIQSAGSNDYNAQMEDLRQAGFNSDSIARIAESASGSPTAYDQSQINELKQDGYTYDQIKALETIGYQLGSHNFIESPGEIRNNQEFVKDTETIKNEFNIPAESAQNLAQYATNEPAHYSAEEVKVLSHNYTTKQIDLLSSLGIAFKNIGKANALDKLEGTSELEGVSGNEEESAKSLETQKGATLHYGKGEDAKRKKLKNYLQAQKDALDKMTKKNQNNE